MAWAEVEEGVQVSDEDGSVHFSESKAIEILHVYCRDHGIHMPAGGFSLAGVRAARGERGTAGYSYRSPFCADGGVTLQIERD